LIVIDLCFFGREDVFLVHTNLAFRKGGHAKVVSLFWWY
jgi:hypothetical protein